MLSLRYDIMTISTWWVPYWREDWWLAGSSRSKSDCWGWSASSFPSPAMSRWSPAVIFSQEDLQSLSHHILSDDKAENAKLEICYQTHVIHDPVLKAIFLWKEQTILWCQYRSYWPGAVQGRDSPRSVCCCRSSRSCFWSCPPDISPWPPLAWDSSGDI